MALKFLNKKGWHTGSLRNIENVWKAEQKHEAEQRKLEELRKQIHEERERAEFRQLQEQAGLISGQERLEFLYDSGLAVGKGSSGFKALESLPKTQPEEAAASSSTSAQPQAAALGALFEEKPQSANDAWRKLTSDPLLLIRKREQEALARIKNNPIQMAMIRKSVEAKKNQDKNEKKHKRKHHRKKSEHRMNASSDNDSEDAALTMENQRESRHRGSKSDKHASKRTHTSDDESNEGDTRRKKSSDDKDRRPSGSPNHKYDKFDDQRKSKRHYDFQRREYSSERQLGSHHGERSYSSTSDRPPRHEANNRHQDPVRLSEDKRADKLKEMGEDKPPRHESNNRHRNPVRLSNEERAAKLKEMEMDAERHEEQRWKRIKKAADADAQEAVLDHASSGRNFLDAAQKSVYGAEKGGSSTIEESVRRRTHYSQRRSDSESNAFRRA